MSRSKNKDDLSTFAVAMLLIIPLFFSPVPLHCEDGKAGPAVCLEIEPAVPEGNCGRLAEDGERVPLSSSSCSLAFIL